MAKALVKRGNAAMDADRPTLAESIDSIVLEY
jgi:hypothetical protein